MKKNNYQNLMEHIQPPAGLNDRVLSAARRRAEETERQTADPKRLLPKKRRPVLRAAVCAACALALVAGTWTLRPSGAAEEDGTPGTALPAFSFGLTAYAADTGESYGAGINGGLAFSTAGESTWSAGEGHYTGCLFQVTGEGIETVFLSLDRGELYRWRPVADLTEAERQELQTALENGEEGSLAPAADGGSAEETVRLGSSVTEAYDPEVRYGFLIPDTGDVDWTGDPRAANQASIDQLDGARLTVTAVFADGTEQTKTYTLSTGKLKVVYDADSPGGTLLPQLAGDEDPWIYGVYAVDTAESRFLQWPVQDCRTISLSAPYGPVNGSFHSGIDIPAPEGEVILAAADGTVTEVGFDPERGNYLVLDHGDGLTTLYGQCRDCTVEEGDTVRAGEMIGAVGATGRATGPHLHFEVRQDDEPQNPVAYFDSDVRDTLSMG